MIYWISEMKIFGCYLVLACVSMLKDDEDQKLLSRLRNANNVTTRNDRMAVVV